MKITTYIISGTAFTLLAAHVFRLGIWPLAFVIALLPALFFLRNNISLIVLKVSMLLGTIEWVRTTVEYSLIRIELGMPWIRLLIILGLVSLLTLFSAILIHSRKFRESHLK